MSEKEPLYQPTVGRRASICQWDLSFRFFTKDQCEKFIIEYMKEEIPINFSYREEMSDGSQPNSHIIDIDEMCWANNLTRIAKILELVDYQQEIYEDEDGK